MFTGIIETVGKLRKASSGEVWIESDIAKLLKKGQSVACNGVCVTILETDRHGFRVEILSETKRLSNLGKLRTKDLVNLERAMKFSDRLDGHLVQGHVEGMGLIKKIDQGIIALKIPKKLMKYCHWKGIIMIDGIALTFVRLDDRKAEIEVALTPYTWENTNLHTRKIGEYVNIETDYIAKIVERFTNHNGVTSNP